MPNSKTDFIKKVKYRLKWITIGSKLLWLFTLWPVLVLSFFYAVCGKVETALTIMAYAMQAGAFCIFLLRINKILKTDDEYSGIKGLLKIWWAKRKRNKVLKSITGNVNLVGKSALIKIRASSNKRLFERVKWLEMMVEKLQEALTTRLQELEIKLGKDIDDLKKELKKFEEEWKNEKKEKVQLQRETYGPELVAILWLLFAALIFAVIQII